MVVPGRKLESTLTRAIAVDLTESRGAWISSNGEDTSKMIDWAWILLGRSGTHSGRRRGWKKRTEDSFACSYDHLLGPSNDYRGVPVNSLSLAASRSCADQVESHCFGGDSDGAGPVEMSGASVEKREVR